MSSSCSIIDEIHQKTGGAYGSWTIGVTGDIDRHFKEHGRPATWFHWRADSEQVASNVESFFLRRGMRYGSQGGGSVYVYICR
jgi:hypothetical protein